MDISNFENYEEVVASNQIDYIVHLGAILSALGEKIPDRAIDVNAHGATHALNLARDLDCQLYIPSSIAVFGGDKFPHIDTPLDTIL